MDIRTLNTLTHELDGAARTAQRGMVLPHAVLPLDAKLSERWDRFYARPGERLRHVEEGLWRRTQDPRNADQSGWADPGHARRRILHYRYEFVADPTMGLVLAQMYVFHSCAYPVPEAAVHHDRVSQALAAGGWAELGEATWRRGSLRCTVAVHDVHPQDVRAGRRMPDGYRHVEVTVRSVGYRPAGPQETELPWKVLAGGMRVKDRRGDPEIAADLSGLADFLPFQVEVGCGMSVEAGIPALHRLHEVYRVTDRADGSFVLSPGADTFLTELLGTPQEKLPELVEMFGACLVAEPTPGHRVLRALARAGHLVGPVITNNFDGLFTRLGMQECYVRRYDEQVPDVPFRPEARALLVIGSHADRRRVQARARERGLKVFFLDPEGFEERGIFRPYPIEGAREGDVLCRREATPALTELATLLGVGN
ncbi:hypothetical protein [Streptomyces sp. NPDC006510]|uniref:hypothetical protein n=1 Tax=Streptomyces sp. NPDC006510 TaxID=3155600 RepID=UPI0033A9C51E